MLDWEENLFVGLRALHRRVFLRPEERRREAVRVRLDEVRMPLLLVAEMVSGQPLSLFETEDRALAGPGRLFLPPEISLASTREANLGLYRLRALLAGLALRRQHQGTAGTVEALAREAGPEFPGLAALAGSVQEALPPGSDLWQAVGELPRHRESLERAGTTDGPVPDGDAGAGESALTEIRGRGQSEVEVTVSPEDDGPGADMPMHTFEKVETLEEYDGRSRKTDDEDELREHEEALHELRMNRVMRSPGRPRSLYRADLILDGSGAEVGGDAPSEGIPYPEWDHRRQQYRPEWCHVQEARLDGDGGAWVQAVEHRHRRLIQRLRRQFAQLTSEWRPLPRQPVGDDFDLAALVDSETARRAGRSPSESVHLGRRREPHDLAALILLDASYSTDGWLADRRVLDVIRETVFCVGEVLADPVPCLGIAAFSSNTRRSCRFVRMKDFRQSWAATRGHLARLEAGGYTRMGPALRHAQELLLNEPASRKVVLLITDGRPCDYDRYEGLYGIRDVRKAIDTGRQQGIQTHAFAIEHQAAESLPQLFPRHHYDILPSADALAGTLCRLFGRLLTR
ncbi:MAG: VWA domain-containing protein [Verrucomicrobia bacterium]|nr:VWA domain-containing protein [Verrucomicrobiota bacterium]